MKNKLSIMSFVLLVSFQQSNGMMAIAHQKNSNSEAEDDKTIQKLKAIELQELFESELAEELMQLDQQGTLAGTVSGRIVAVMDSHEDAIMKVLAEEGALGRIKEAMYKKTILGHLPHEKSKANEIVDDIKQVFKNGKSKLETVLPLQAIVGYQIIKNLKEKNGDNKEYAALYNKAYTQDGTNGLKKMVFGKDIRQEKDGQTELTHLQGTMTEKSPYAHNTRPLHFRGMDKFVIDQSKKETQQVIVQIFGRSDIPIASGPSTHTSNALSSAYALGLQSHEFKEYVGEFACYMVHAGHHSFHEAVRIGAFSPFNVPYNVNNYAEYMSSSFKHTESYKKLMAKYKATSWLVDGKKDELAEEKKD